MIQIRFTSFFIADRCIQRTTTSIGYHDSTVLCRSFQNFPPVQPQFPRPIDFSFSFGRRNDATGRFKVFFRYFNQSNQGHLYEEIRSLRHIKFLIVKRYSKIHFSHSKDRNYFSHFPLIIGSRRPRYNRHKSLKRILQ